MNTERSSGNGLKHSEGLQDYFDNSGMIPQDNLIPILEKVLCPKHTGTPPCFTVGTSQSTYASGSVLQEISSQALFLAAQVHDHHHKVEEVIKASSFLVSGPNLC
ncbi:hypothetical protein TNCV_3408001 [Trichonephila clavipes]|nr:hypothetical protein TNCV_3408001 [Trichonephila clavipes]